MRSNPLVKVVALETDPTIAAELVMQVRFFHTPSRTRDRSASLLQGTRKNSGHRIVVEKIFCYIAMR